MTGVTAIRGDITNITSTKPPVVTSASNGLSNGDIVRITQVSGSVCVNNREYRVNNTETNTFELQDEQTHTDIDGTNFDTYQSGGRWNRVNRDGPDRVFYEPQRR